MLRGLTFVVGLSTLLLLRDTLLASPLASLLAPLTVLLLPRLLARFFATSFSSFFSFSLLMLMCVHRPLKGKYSPTRSQYFFPYFGYFFLEISSVIHPLPWNSMHSSTQPLALQFRSAPVAETENK